MPVVIEAVLLVSDDLREAPAGSSYPPATCDGCDVPLLDAGQPAIVRNRCGPPAVRWAYLCSDCLRAIRRAEGARVRSAS